MHTRVTSKQYIYLMNLNFLGWSSGQVADGETVAEAGVVSYSEPATAELTWHSQVVKWLLFISVLFVPLFVLPATTSVLELNKLLFAVLAAGVGLIVWLLSVVSSGKLVLRFNPIDKAVLAIAAATVIGVFFSVYKYKSIFGLPVSLSESLISIIALSLLYFLIVNMFNDRGEKIKLILLIGVSLSLVYGFLQILGIHIFKTALTNSRAFNTIGSINTLTLAGAVMMPLLFKNDIRGWLGHLFRLAGLIAVALLVILNWWVLWLVAIAGMVALTTLESLQQQGFKINRFILPMTVIVLAVFMMVVNFSVGPIRNKLPIEVAPAYGLSFDVVKSVFKENFLTGYGPENFSMAFDRYGASRLANTSVSNAKFFDGTSQFLGWLSSGGLLMLGAVIILLWSIVSSLRYSFRSRMSAREVRVSQGVLASMAALTVMMFLYPFNFTLMFLFYVLLGLTVLTLWGHEHRVYNIEDRSALSLASSLGFIGGLILALVGVYFTLSIYIGDVIYARTLNERDSAKAASLLNDAVNWNDGYDLYYRSASQTSLNLLAGELNARPDPKDTRRTARIQGYLNSSVNLAKRATELNAKESINWENLGDVYRNLMTLVDGTDALAEESYRKALKFRPGDAALYHKIGSMYLARGDFLRQLAANQSANAGQLNQLALTAYAKAEANYKKATEISSNFGLAIYNLGVVYEREGKVREAISQLEKIIPFNSNQANLLFELGLLYYRNGEKDKSFSAFQQAVVLVPDYANAHWYLALIYEERRDIAAAIGELEKILDVEANEDNPVVISKLQDLKRGQITIPPQKVIDQKPL